MADPVSAFDGAFEEGAAGKQEVEVKIKVPINGGLPEQRGIDQGGEERNLPDRLLF